MPMNLKRISAAIYWWNFQKAQQELVYANHKRRMISDSFKKIKSWGIAGSYLEFGTYRGQSIVYAYEEKELMFKTTQTGITKIYAFDSFKGIKGVVSEESAGPFAEGLYAADFSSYLNYLNERGVPVDEIVTIPGYFQETLTSKLQQNILEECPVAAVVNIDCDIYYPALCALNFVALMLRQGSIVLFDDWYSYALDSKMGEVRALNEFLQKNKQIEFLFWKDYGPVGKSFIVSKKNE